MFLKLFPLWPPVTRSCVEIERFPALNPLPSPYHGHWMLADVSQRCYTGTHLHYIIAIGIPGAALFIIGVPLGMIITLHRNRARLQDPRVVGRLGFLYYGALLAQVQPSFRCARAGGQSIDPALPSRTGYRPHVASWEAVIMMRKLAIVGITIFLTGTGTAL